MQSWMWGLFTLSPQQFQKGIAPYTDRELKNQDTLVRVVTLVTEGKEETCCCTPIISVRMIGVDIEEPMIKYVSTIGYRSHFAQSF